jgi:hypothetical protein
VDAAVEGVVVILVVLVVAAGVGSVVVVVVVLRSCHRMLLESAKGKVSCGGDLGMLSIYIGLFYVKSTVTSLAPNHLPSKILPSTL